MKTHNKALLSLIMIPAICQALTCEWIRFYNQLYHFEESGVSFFCVTPIEDRRFMLGGAIFGYADTLYEYIWFGEASVDSDTIYYQNHFGSGYFYGYVEKLLINQDGGLTLFGYSYLGDDHFGRDDYRLTALCLDENRDSLWQCDYGDPNRNYFVDAIERDDGGHLICATGQLDQYHILLFVIDSDGSLDTAISYRDPDDEYGLVPLGMLNLDDDGYLIYGRYRSDYRHPEESGLLMRLNNNYEIDWVSTITDSVSGRGAQNARFRSVIPSSDGGFLIAGGLDYGTIDNHNEKQWIVKVDDEGNLQWQKVYYDNPRDGSSWFSQIFETEDGKILAFGRTVIYNNQDASGPYIILANEDGDIIEDLLIEELDWDDGFRDIVAINNDEYIALFTAQRRVCKINLRQGSVDDNLLTTIKSFELLSAYPNPFNQTTRIRFSIPSWSVPELRVYDTAGRPVEAVSLGNLAPGVHERLLTFPNLPSGLYLLELQAAGEISYTRINYLK